MAGFSLDCRPLPAPVSPFAWMAAMMRADTYPGPKEAEEAGQMARWLEYLAVQLPDVQSAEPLILSAIARLACDAHARRNVRGALEKIEAVLARAQPANGAGGPPANGQGYKIR